MNVNKRKGKAIKKLSELLGYNLIDIHSHFDHGVVGDADYEHKPDRKNIHKASIDFLFSEYDNIGIFVGAFYSFSSVLSSVRVAEENEYMEKLAQREKRIYQWVVIHPDIDETFRQAKDMLLSDKVLGIKIHSPCHGYDICERYEKIFSLANGASAVVLMHPQNIMRMPEICDNYPNMKLIIAHLGSEEHVLAVKNSKVGNIYVDTSGGSSNLNNVVEYAVKNVGAGKTLFGTDTYSSAFQAGRVAFARISDEDKRLILRDNAIRLFPRAFKSES